jgi:hypothetical protein
MLMVNQLPIKRLVAPKVQSNKNYNYNKSFFQNKMIPDMQPVVMNNLDHRSNIQFISTSKHLYKRYVQETENGGIYHPYLFTKHPFQFSTPVDFNIYFDCYSRALFHYAPQHEVQTKILLSIEDEIIQDASAEMLKKCKINGSDTNAVMNFYRQQFSWDQFCAIISDSSFLGVMLKRGVSPNAQTSLGSFLTVCITSCGNYKDKLKCLLADPRIDINMADKSGQIALRHAALHNSEALTILLADDRCNCNIQDENGQTILMELIEDNKIEKIKILTMVHGIDFNIKDKYGRTAFIKGARFNRIEVLEMLLADHRMDPNIQDEDGCTALMHTVLHEKIEALKLLLAANRVDHNIKDKKGRTAFMLATIFGNIEVVDILGAHIKQS